VVLRWVTGPTKERVEDYTAKQPQKREQTYQLQQRALPATSRMVGKLNGEFESFKCAYRLRHMPQV